MQLHRLQSKFALCFGLLLIAASACRSAPESESAASPPTTSPQAAESTPPPTTTVTLRLSDNGEINATVTGAKVAYEAKDTATGNVITCDGTLAGEVITITCDSAPTCTINFSKDSTATATLYVQTNQLCS